MWQHCLMAFNKLIMAKKKIFVSFDYEKDKMYKYLLEAWDANPHFDFSFNDQSPDEIQSNLISVVKANLTRKINDSTYTLVLCGKEVNKLHKDHVQIGYCNWQNYEIARSILNGNKIILVKLYDDFQVPVEARCCHPIIVEEFSKEAIIEGLEKAQNR